jgi:hypothetical protein
MRGFASRLLRGQDCHWGVIPTLLASTPRCRRTLCRPLPYQTAEASDSNEEEQKSGCTEVHEPPEAEIDPSWHEPNAGAPRTSAYAFTHNPGAFHNAPVKADVLSKTAALDARIAQKAFDGCVGAVVRSRGRANLTTLWITSLTSPLPPRTMPTRHRTFRCSE